MGAGSSHLDKVGDEVFRLAEELLATDDADTLERVTGIVVSGSSLEELQFLLKEDRKKLESRLKEAACLVEKGEGSVGTNSGICLKLGVKNSKEDGGRRETKQFDLLKRKEELVAQLHRTRPGLDAQKVSSELLKLSEGDLGRILSSTTEFESFVTFLSAEDEFEDLKVGPTSEVLDSKELLEKLKQEQLDKFSKQEINDEDVTTIIGNHLYKRVSLLHPSKAELITGILMQQDKDTILQLLISAPVLHQNIASVISELKVCKKLNHKDLTLMVEELGDLIYSLLEKAMDPDTAGRVTGMLLEMDIAQLHESLSDASLFSKHIKDAETVAR